MRISFELQSDLRNAIGSIHSLSNLKYVGIFNYIEDRVRILTICTEIVYFLKGQ